MNCATKLLLCLSFAVAPLSGQDPAKADDDEVQKTRKIDPFTDGDEAKMKALGVERYAPFPWADGITTDDIDRVLGEGRMLWMETAHFRLGLNLGTVKPPTESGMKKVVRDECATLHGRLADFPERPKRLAPWVRMHLYALRAEQAYKQFRELVGEPEDEGGSYLGLPDKFLLLLFQKKSDMARYMDRFCGLKADSSMRYFHQKSKQMLVCVSAEGMEGFEAAGLHGHVVFALWQNFVNGYRGHDFTAPFWLGIGLAHWYSRQIPTQVVNAQVRDDESVSKEGQHKWANKVFRRARHEGALIPFATIGAIEKWEEFGFHEHCQAWSRVDFLMERDQAKVGELLRKLQDLPRGGDFAALSKQANATAIQLVEELFGLDAAAFDTEWRDWVLRTYPKRKD